MAAARKRRPMSPRGPYLRRSARRFREVAGADLPFQDLERPGDERSRLGPVEAVLFAHPQPGLDRAEDPQQAGRAAADVLVAQVRQRPGDDGEKPLRAVAPGLRGAPGSALSTASAVASTGWLSPAWKAFSIQAVQSFGVSRSDRSIPARSLTVAMAGRSWGRDNGFAKTHAYGGDAGARKGTPRRYSRSVARDAHGE